MGLNCSVHARPIPLTAPARVLGAGPTKRIYSAASISSTCQRRTGEPWQRSGVTAISGPNPLTRWMATDPADLPRNFRLPQA